MTDQVFPRAAARGHEQVAFFHDQTVGLKAIVGMHSTVLGPALGGCRMRLYDSETAALEDVMRLSEGMTYKNSLAGLDLGGGKACIIANPRMTEGRRELFLRFAEFLNRLGGKYITAEDMGTSVADVMCMREVTQYAAGYAIDAGGSGDPSPWTALGVFQAIKAACERHYGTEGLNDRTVTVQGLGHVGMYLVEHLAEAGAKVIGTDTHDSNIEKAKQSFGIEAVSVEEIYDVECDVYAPCAVGQTVNRETIPRLKCEIIAGAANNQLSDPGIYDQLNEQKMLYLPDFAINSGGVISVAAEVSEGGWQEKRVAEQVHAIYQTAQRILEESEKRNKFPEVVALELAKERIEEAQLR